MKVKVYDLIKVLSDAAGEQFYGSEVNALILGADKAILVDDEAVHTIHHISEGLRTTVIVVDSCGIQKDLLVSCVKKTVRITFDRLQKAEPLREEELGEFVRTFGQRIENNYTDLLKSIREIGLDPNDYPRDGIYDRKRS